MRRTLLAFGCRRGEVMMAVVDAAGVDVGNGVDTPLVVLERLEVFAAGVLAVERSSDPAWWRYSTSASGGGVRKKN